MSACSSVSKPAAVGTAAPAANGYKVGKPYAVNGTWYFPRVDYAYDVVGIASWYGPGFDGQTTANGETYDMNELTAAHKTLPMPSIVRVTNLDNGRSIKLRVNDRGPFVDGRIIDVSRRAAQLLGLYGAGTAHVRVEIVADESRQLALALTGSDQEPLADAQPASFLATAVVNDAVVADAAGAGLEQATAGSVATQPMSPEASPVVAPAPIAAPDIETTGTGTPVAPPATSPAAPVATGGHAYVQAGAFTEPDNAKRAKSRLARLGTVEIASTNVDGRNLFRVRLGPFPSDTEAHRVLAAAIREGFSGSRVVFE